MAKFIPNLNESYIFNFGEREVYKKLKELPNDYYVFYSLEWLDMENGKFSFGEGDYIIYHPKKGILVMEIKAGSIEAIDRKIYQINGKTGEKKVIKPLEQARRTKYKLDKEIYNQCPVQVVTCFVSIESRADIKELPLDYDKNIILTKYELNNIEESLSKVYNFYKMSSKEILKDTILRILNPKFNAIEKMKNMIEVDDRIFIQMTEEQKRILDFLEDEKEATIMGGAGTGKTILAVEKARRLKEKTLFLCYNKFLISELKRKYGEELKNVEFMSLKSLINRVDNDLKLLSYDQNFEYKNIVIDEGQDFTTKQLESLYNVVKERDGIFYLFYDQNQLINKNTSKENWKEPVNKSKLKLTVNCRNTKKIAYFSYECIVDKGDVIVNSKLPGKKINFNLVENKEEILPIIERILSNYSKEDIRASDIVLLSLKSKENSTLDKIKKIGNYEISTEMIEDDKILNTTVRKYKGLESKIVIMYDFDEEVLNTSDSYNLFYVGSSRAVHILHVISEIPVNKIPFLNDNYQKVKSVIKE